MKESIGEGGARGYTVPVHLAQGQGAIGGQAEGIAARAVREDRGVAGDHGNDCVAGPPDPSRDGKVLQLQVGWAADLHQIGVAIKHKAKTDRARAEGGVAPQNSVIAAGRIQGIGLSAPPTDHPGWDRQARSGIRPRAEKTRSNQDQSNQTWEASAAEDLLHKRVWPAFL